MEYPLNTRKSWLVLVKNNRGPLQLKRLISIKLGIIALILGGCTIHNSIHAQKVIQCSGFIHELNSEETIRIPFALIRVANTYRASFSNMEGFYSLPVREGEQLEFYSVGYKKTVITIPSNIEGDSYRLEVQLIKDDILLPELTIKPWPNKDRFQIEFLAMDPDTKLEEVAKDNLSPQKLAALAELLVADGKEGGQFYQRQVIATTYYAGQVRPMPIFDIMAWMKFIKAIQDGQFKKKKPKKGE